MFYYKSRTCSLNKFWRIEKTKLKTSVIKINLIIIIKPAGRGLALGGSRAAGLRSGFSLSSELAGRRALRCLPRPGPCAAGPRGVLVANSRSGTRQDLCSGSSLLLVITSSSVGCLTLTPVSWPGTGCRGAHFAVQRCRIRAMSLLKAVAWRPGGAGTQPATCAACVWIVNVNEETKTVLCEKFFIIAGFTHLII